MAQITRTNYTLDGAITTMKAIYQLEITSYTMSFSVDDRGRDVWTFTVYVDPEEPADEQEENNDPLLLREAEQAMRKDMDNLQQAVGASHPALSEAHVTMNACHAYYENFAKEHGHRGFIWLHNTDTDQLMVYTRGEHTNDLFQFLATFNARGGTIYSK